MLVTLVPSSVDDFGKSGIFITSLKWDCFGSRLISKPGERVVL